jgi:hypothetical protein
MTAPHEAASTYCREVQAESKNAIVRMNGAHPQRWQGDLKEFRSMVGDLAFDPTQDFRGCLLIHIAARRGNSAACKEIIDLGTSPNVLNSDGLTPLFLAAGAGMTQTCYDLMGWGADPEIRCKDRRVTEHAKRMFQWETALGIEAFLSSRTASDSIDRVIVEMLRSGA